MSTEPVTVSTTAGPVDVADLGRTLVHEHVLMRSPGAQWDPTATFDRRDIIERAVDALAEVRDHGVRTFVDPCPMELGRDPEMLAEVADRSGVRIVCATGFYLERDGWGIPFYWRQRQPEEICELFVSEIEGGIGDTGIRPGVIKVATGTEVGRDERKVLLAAGMASAATGTTVVTHTDESRHGDQQQALLAEGGADLSRCLIGHQDNQTAEGLAALARAGSMVGVDRVGWDILGSDDHRADVVAAMFREGLADHLCISQDRVCTLWAPKPEFWVPCCKQEYVDNTVVPNIYRDGTAKGFTYLFTHFLPKLRERGLTEQQIEQLLVDNPRRLFGGAPRGTESATGPDATLVAQHGVSQHGATQHGEA